jgi:hypothetical protein
MQINRQELVRSAGRRVHGGRKTAGRIVVSALGFGVAYYFDTENGALRRKRLHQMLQRTAHKVSAAVVTDAEDPPPVFHPVLRTHRTEECAPRPGGRAAAAR